MKTAVIVMWHWSNITYKFVFVSLKHSPALNITIVYCYYKIAELSSVVGVIPSPDATGLNKNVLLSRVTQVIKLRLVM